MQSASGHGSSIADTQVDRDRFVDEVRHTCAVAAVPAGNDGEAVPYVADIDIGVVCVSIDLMAQRRSRHSQVVLFLVEALDSGGEARLLSSDLGEQAVGVLVRC